MTHLSRLAIVALFILALPACLKPELRTISNYSFDNTLNERVTLDLYGSRDDYDNNLNRIARYYVPPGSNTVIPLQVLKTYWLDWYSDGYSYNNWINNAILNPGVAGNYPAFPIPQFTVAAENDHMTISTDTRDTARSVLLNGNELSSTWEVTVSDMPAFNGKHTFTFKRTATGQYLFTPTSGNAITRSFRYELYAYEYTQNRAISFALIAIDSDEKILAELFFNQGPVKSSRDTLMVGFPLSGDTYPAVRQ